MLSVVHWQSRRKSDHKLWIFYTMSRWKMSQHLRLRTLNTIAIWVVTVVLKGWASWRLVVLDAILFTPRLPMAGRENRV